MSDNVKTTDDLDESINKIHVLREQFLDGFLLEKEYLAHMLRNSLNLAEKSRDIYAERGYLIEN